MVQGASKKNRDTRNEFNGTRSDIETNSAETKRSETKTHNEANEAMRNVRPAKNNEPKRTETPLLAARGA